MTHEDLIDLVDRATDDAGWDTDRLVAGATRTGRGRLRRRRAAIAVATLAVVGVGATGVARLGGDDTSRGVDRQYASQQASPTPGTTAGTSSSATGTASSTAASPRPTDAAGRWQLAVTAARVPQTFASILPGTITKLPQKERDDTTAVDFRWNGYALRVGLARDDYITGKRVTDARTRCADQSSGQGCTPGERSGSWETSMTWTGPAVDGGATYRVLVVSFAEGWDVTVLEANAATKDGAPISPGLPLTLDQLRQVAYSDAWFR